MWVVTLDVGTEQVVREVNAQTGSDAIGIAFTALLLERRAKLKPLSLGYLRAEAAPA